MRVNQESSGCHDEEKKKQARAFCRAGHLLENALEDGTFCFKFAELCHLYERRLQEFGIEREVSKVCFKVKILSYFHEAQAQNEKRNPCFSGNATTSEACS